MRCVPHFGTAPHLRAVSTLLAAGLFLASAAPLSAQAQTAPAGQQVRGQDQRARIDDFAVATPERASIVQIDQLTSNRRDITARAIPISKPSVTIPDLIPADLTRDAGASASAPMAQVSAVKRDPQLGSSAQLTDSAQSHDIASASISSKQSSRPTGVERLSGTDRCAPGEETAQAENCANILEERASQFAATQAAPDDQEQDLLAGNGEDSTTKNTLATRLDLAARDNPNANISSNQELASLYLNPAQNTQLEIDLPNNTGEVVEALLEVIQGGNNAPPPSLTP